MNPVESEIKQFDHQVLYLRKVHYYCYFSAAVKNWKKLKFFDFLENFEFFDFFRSTLMRGLWLPNAGLSLLGCL